jgi:hypothetical protein
VAPIGPAGVPLPSAPLKSPSDRNRPELPKKPSKPAVVPVFRLSVPGRICTADVPLDTGPVAL